LTEHLSSHFARSGGAQDAQEHKNTDPMGNFTRSAGYLLFLNMICIQLLLHNLLFLGGWTLESVQTIFNYIVGSSKTDAYVARVQSGWSNIQEDGICPNIEAIPLVDHELFKTWSVIFLVQWNWIQHRYKV
jgi:hypothetical protein